MSPPNRPLELVGPRVTLRLMRPSDRDALLSAAADGALWNLKVTIVPSQDTIDGYIAAALDGLATGTMLPFVIIRNATQDVVGTTRFWKIDRAHRKLEIGWTWLAQRCQRTFVNTECKFLLLQHAFEQWQCIRVQFQTDEFNVASRNAILRLGAKQEGILRHERIMPDGRFRNSVRFSILDHEWPAIRNNLQRRLAAAEPEVTHGDRDVSRG